MWTNKYAVRFPGFENVNTKSSLSVFSENEIAKSENTFFKTFDLAYNLSDFVIQKNKTSELRKQLNAQKQALDVEIDNKIEQSKIQYEEESRRLQLRIEQEKKEMNLELKRLELETAKKAKDFSFSYEEYMKSNKIFRKIIIHEKAFLEETHRYIEFLGSDFSNRKEYILYCDFERKSLELINNYLKLMI